MSDTITLSWQVIASLGAGIFAVLVAATSGIFRIMNSQAKHWKDQKDSIERYLNARIEEKDREIEKLRSRPITPDDPSEQARIYVAEDKRIRDLPAEKLVQSLNPTVGGEIWGQFYRYRATVRSLLRHLCLSHNIPIHNSQSISSMANMLLDKQLISARTATDVKKIAWATYTAQWGVGEAPTTDDAKFVAENAKKVIEELSTLRL